MGPARFATLQRHVMPAEQIMLAITLGLMAMAAVLLAARGYAVDWLAYVPIIGGGMALIGLGLYYRVSDRSATIGATLVGVGCYIEFAAVASAFNYMLLPIWRSPIDPWLVRIDAALGFHWPDALALAANWPWLVETMRYAYMSSHAQLAIIVLTLGFTARTRHLQTFMLATTLTCLATVGFWSLLPSFGTSTIYELPPDLLARLRPVVSNNYGTELLRLAAEGPKLISPKDTLGLIAAPSFHTVMALLAIFGAWPLVWLRWPALAVNLMVLPGTIVHGGHHLIDVIAGAGVTVAGVWLAARLVDGARPRPVELRA